MRQSCGRLIARNELLRTCTDEREENRDQVSRDDESTRAASVFISYARKDLATVQPIVDELTDRGDLPIVPLSATSETAKIWRELSMLRF